jgi:hypothetical protein
MSVLIFSIVKKCQVVPGISLEIQFKENADDNLDTEGRTSRRYGENLHVFFTSVQMHLTKEIISMF